MISHRLDRFERAREAGETALALRRELGDKTQIATRMMNLANPLTRYATTSGHRRSTKNVSRCSARSAIAGTDLPAVNLGGLYYEMGKPQEALACYEESLAISHEVGETDWARALTWNNIGEAYIVLDEPARAIEVTEPNYQLFTREHDVFGAATCAFTLGRAQWRQSDGAAARAYLDEAERLFRNLGNPAWWRASAIFVLASQSNRAKPSGAPRSNPGARRPRWPDRANEDTWWLVERAATLAHFCGAPAQAALLYAAGIAHRDALGALVEPPSARCALATAHGFSARWERPRSPAPWPKGDHSPDDASAHLTQMLHQGRRANETIG